MSRGLGLWIGLEKGVRGLRLAWILKGIKDLVYHLLIG